MKYGPGFSVVCKMRKPLCPGTPLTPSRCIPGMMIDVGSCSVRFHYLVLLKICALNPVGVKSRKTKGLSSVNAKTFTSNALQKSLHSHTVNLVTLSERIYSPKGACDYFAQVVSQYIDESETNSSYFCRETVRLRMQLLCAIQMIKLMR